jgi:hypothetical protein
VKPLRIQNASDDYRTFQLEQEGWGIVASVEHTSDFENFPHMLAAAPQMLEALQEAWNVICWAAQEAQGRVDKQKVGGWLHHAAKINEVIKLAKGEKQK